MSWLKNLGNSISTEQKHIAEQLAQAAKNANNSLHIAEQKIKEAAQKADALAKKAAQDALNKAKQDFIKFKDLNKKIFKSLKDLTGKVRGAFKKLLRKAALKMVYNSIKLNVHGFATRLYPAIAPISDLKRKGFAAKFQPKSKNVYSELLAKWIEMGGTKDKLDEAIMAGAGRRMHKFKTNPYKPTGTATGTDLTKRTSKSFSKLGFDGDYSNVDGDANTSESSTFDAGADIGTGSAANVNSDDQKELADAGATDVSPEEKHKHWTAFVSWIHNLFHKHKAADESPYDDSAAGTGGGDAGGNSDAANYKVDAEEDKTNTDALNNIPAADVNDIVGSISPKTPDSLDKGNSQVKIKLPKADASKTKEILFAVGGAAALSAVAFYAFPTKRKLFLPIAILAGAAAGYFAGSKFGGTKAHPATPVDPSKLKI